MFKYAMGVSLVIVAACGGDDGGGDTTPDATVTIDGVTVCPGGWTVTEAVAVQQDGSNNIRVSAGCTTGTIDEVLLLFSPLPPGGVGAVPCFQATMFIDGGAHTQCRVNNMTQMDPGGSITIGQPATGYVQGTCTCMGDQLGSTATAGANLVLTLQ